MERQIEGVITDTAIAGGTDLIIFLRPWRERDGKVQVRELRVVVPLKNERAASRAMSSWQGKAVRLPVETLEYPTAKKRWGLALGKPPLRRIDAESVAAKARSRERAPVVVEDSDLGSLQLNRRLGWYEAERRMGRRSYELGIEVVDPDDPKTVKRALRRARTVVTRTEANMAEILEAVSNELLETYNARWRPGGRPITAAGFVKRLKLSSLVVAQGGTTVWLECGGLFSDHGVEVRFSPRGKIREILIA